MAKITKLADFQTNDATVTVSMRQFNTMMYAMECAISHARDMASSNMLNPDRRRDYADRADTWSSLRNTFDETITRGTK
jgi:hypothetical protein